MAVTHLIRALLILPLFFAPCFAQFNYNFGFLNTLFNPEKLNADASTIYDGNDGGLKGDAGKYEEQIDSQTGGNAGFVEPEAMEVQAMDFIPTQDDFELNYGGRWEIVSQNSGVSAMHMQLMPHGEVLMFDSTVLGPSKYHLPAGDRCRLGADRKWDCWAHAMMFDIETRQSRPLHIVTDPWCSSGGLTINGSLLSTGGFGDGDRSVRLINPCKTCDWNDIPQALGSGRWYATQAKLQDGTFIVLGGRKSYNFELVPDNGHTRGVATYSAFIDETSDIDENNLYPFVHLLPDGNLFVFANSRSMLFNPIQNKVIKEFPRLLGGSRNYPASGMSALLPIVMDESNDLDKVKAQVLVCGGAKPKAYRLADPERKGKIVHMRALLDCGRLDVSDPNPTWMRENMPSRRVMGDMLILPTGEILMINGARKGTAAWNHAIEPNFHPIVFNPSKTGKDRYKAMAPTNIPRMYHSTSAVLPDGSILVGGSNTNPVYMFENVQFPTEMRLEKFYPHYLDPNFQQYRPQILKEQSDPRMTYGNDFHIAFQIPAANGNVQNQEIKVTMYAPPFTTHGYSMNQRLIQLAAPSVTSQGAVHHADAKAPPSGTIAPPGFYLVFVVYRGIPSVGEWIQIAN